MAQVLITKSNNWKLNIIAMDPYKELKNGFIFANWGEN